MVGISDAVALTNIIHGLKDLRSAGETNSELMKVLGRCLQVAADSNHNESFVGFAGACMEIVDSSKAQNFQDVWALYELKGKKGFFVEFGAADGVQASTTYLLEKEYGWEGILIEPNPFWYDSLRENRTAILVTDRCVGTEPGYVDFYDREDDPLLSGMGTKNPISDMISENPRKVRCDTLYDILEEYGAPTSIDFVSVDVEGYDYPVLKKFFEENKKYDVKMFCVEHNFETDTRENIAEVMTANGYVRKFPLISRWDEFYIKEV